MRFLVTGAAGFIGYHVSSRLLAMGHHVVGVDNENDYYDVALKKARVEQLNEEARSDGTVGRFEYILADIKDWDHVYRIRNSYRKLDGVCHLAAQAGVRHSLINPLQCLNTNVIGFANILEAFKDCPRFIYASSSSVYGDAEPPLKINKVGRPLSPYAASKQADESIAAAYQSSFGTNCVGLRYFSVYGPWGRPDMAAFLFLEKMLAGETIELYNNGDMRRDWTYVGDVAAATVRLLVDGREGGTPGSVENIASCRAEKLTDFIKYLEDVSGLTASIHLTPMQPGDVRVTEADMSILEFLDIQPTRIKEGLRLFVEWHRGFYPEKWVKVAQGAI